MLALSGEGGRWLLMRSCRNRVVGRRLSISWRASLDMSGLWSSTGPAFFSGWDLVHRIIGAVSATPPPFTTLYLPFFLDQWQLNINSATSALMIFVFSFLAILRERHTDHVRTCLAAIHRVDSLLELKLRTLTSDHMPNSPVEIPPLRMNRIQRAITYYADIVGALTGVALLILVIIAWLAIGPVLKFDTNWWLLIGTYAGLVGLIDGFVLRNIQHKLQAHEDPQYTELADEDDRLFAMWAIPINNAENDNDDGKVSHRLSRAMGTICGHEIMVLAGLFLVLGLLTGASVMRWSETGQLLCNIPPSVVESFFMIILITGHNAGEAKRRVQLERLFERRLRLIEFVDAVGEETMQGGGVVGVEVEVLEK